MSSPLFANNNNNNKVIIYFQNRQMLLVFLLFSNMFRVHKLFYDDNNCCEIFSPAYLTYKIPEEIYPPGTLYVKQSIC